MFVQHLKIYTRRLDALRSFYRETLGFHFEEDNTQQITLPAGHSRLTFALSDREFYYHFAFNIPSDQSGEALRWLEERVDVLSDNGQKLIDFSNWNAEAVYFRDPAGNIVEFIARKNLQLRSNIPFSVAGIEGISEVGLPVKEVRNAYEQVHRQTGIEKYSGDYSRFCATGDERGLFIIVDQAEKQWYPTKQPAIPAPLELQFSRQGNQYQLKYDGEEIEIEERR